jgi:TonB family protein
MRSWALSLVTSVGLLPNASPANAQQQPATPPQVWHLDFPNSYCALSTGDVRTAGVEIAMTPGDPAAELYFIGSPKMLPYASLISKQTVTLLPGGETFSPPALNVSEGSAKMALRFLRLDPGFPAALARSTEIELKGMKQPVPITGSGKAVAALRQCIDDKLVEWGVDTKAYEALRMPATDIEGHPWASGNDYPPEAANGHAQGDVIARVDVDVTGKVTGCAVVVSSGFKPLDEQTCRIALSQKGRFNPAIGADGRPTASQRVLRAMWRIPLGH